jgi:hypothetical protein
MLSTVAMISSPALWLKLIGALVGIGWVIWGIVICVRLDRIGDVLEKKYNEQKSQRKEEGGLQ